MDIRRTESKGRRLWILDNDALQLGVMEGGGHISSLALRGGPRINPYWEPAWKTMEPWQYRPSMAPRLGSRLLASISGHNPCLAMFGDPSAAEARAGIDCHGEAPVARWKEHGRRLGGRRAQLLCGCELPAAQMRFTREFTLERDSNLVRVKSRVENLARRDVPFTMCEHVTFGPPFLERDVTVFDMPATIGHTFPGAFSDAQRFESHTPFRWPRGPGRKGPVNMRTIAGTPRRSSDFTTQLMNPALEHAWFSALNPHSGLLIAYVWRREDFPWLGNWEENFGRRTPPWNGISLTRGMEFTNTPFSVGLRNAVDMGRFHGLPTYRWLPALSSLETEFTIMAMRVSSRCRGVKSIQPDGARLRVELVL